MRMLAAGLFGLACYWAASHAEVGWGKTKIRELCFSMGRKRQRCRRLGVRFRGLSPEYFRTIGCDGKRL